MKKILATIAALVCTTMAAQAQEVVFDNGTTQLYSNGFVKSIDGFVEKETCLNNLYYSTGVYSADGSVLLYMNASSTCSVAPGTKAIANMAFNRCEEAVYLPTSVKYISPKAFESNDANTLRLRVSDEIEEITVSAREHTSSDEADEVARYNTKGMRLDKAERGLNIVKMSDDTTRKELVK